MWVSENLTGNTNSYHLKGDKKKTPNHLHCFSFHSCFDDNETCFMYQYIINTMKSTRANTICCTTAISIIYIFELNNTTLHLLSLKTVCTTCCILCTYFCASYALHYIHIFFQATVALLFLYECNRPSPPKTHVIYAHAPHIVIIIVINICLH